MLNAGVVCTENFAVCEVNILETDMINLLKAFAPLSVYPWPEEIWEHDNKILMQFLSHFADSTEANEEYMPDESVRDRLMKRFPQHFDLNHAEEQVDRLMSALAITNQRKEGLALWARQMVGIEKSSPIHQPNPYKISVFSDADPQDPAAPGSGQEY